MLDTTRWQLFLELGDGTHSRAAVAAALSRLRSRYTVDDCAEEGFIRKVAGGYTVPSS